MGGRTTVIPTYSRSALAGSGREARFRSTTDNQYGAISASDTGRRRAAFRASDEIRHR
jgi:hypothetical protein